MIIKSSAPCRISLIGGGTDISPFSELYGGATISFAINIRQTFTLYEGKNLWRINDNQIPIDGQLDFVYAFRERFGVNSMHHNRFISESDGGIRGGIGSSAAIAVAMVGALAKSQNKTLNRSEIAELAWEIETQDLKMFGGKQDQYSAAYGGFNLLEFNNQVTVKPFERKYIEKILPSIVLLHTDCERKNNQIQEGFKKLNNQQIKSLKQLKNLIIPTVEAIYESNAFLLGEILDTAWNYKKKSNKGITNPRISNIYQYAKQHGAIGGKVCGAGGGGFMIFIVDPAKRISFIKKMILYGLTWWDFDVDLTGLDIRIMP